MDSISAGPGLAFGARAHVFRTRPRRTGTPPLGAFGSSSSQHRRTLELVLQKGRASFRPSQTEGERCLLTTASLGGMRIFRGPQILGGNVAKLVHEKALKSIPALAARAPLSPSHPASQNIPP